MIRRYCVGDLLPVSAHRAFTLVESTVSLLIVAGMLVAALNMVGSAARARQIQTAQGRGLALAGNLMTEILCTRYKDQDSTSTSGPEPDEANGSRAYFDDVDDYDNWFASPPQTKNGMTLADYDGWTRKVNVTFADPMQPAQNSGSDSGLKRITVSVTSDKNVETKLVALRAENGAYEYTIARDTTLVGSVGVTLQIGQAGPAVVSGINLLNEVEGEALDGNEQANHPPEAVATGMPLMGNVPLTVTFSGAGSSDPDPDDTMTYTWDFGDGNSDNGETIVHTFMQQGMCDVTLTVSDNHGATDTASLTVKVQGM